MNRRRFLGLSALALTGGSAQPASGQTTPVSMRAAGRPRLAMPPLLDTRTSGRLFLTAQTGESRFRDGAATRTAGFNQDYLGPTIVLRSGPLAASVENRLPETVTAHWHGLLVPGEHDGGPHSPIEPGGRWDVAMDLAQRPATCWYHSHAHGATARHVYFGLAGIIHVSDGRDDDRGLPSRYGIDDLTLVLQDRRFDASGRMVYEPDSTDILNGFHGERMLINGQFDAVAAVPRAIVRLRLVNGSNARVYTLHFDDRRDMHVIATDGGFLPQPQPANYIRLAPGNRVEVLVDFRTGPAPVLLSASGLAMRILDFAFDEALGARIARLPDAIEADAFPVPEAEMRSRRFNLNMGGSSTGQAAMSHAGHGAGGHVVHGTPIGASPDGRLAGVAMNDFGINGRPHDLRRIDLDVKLGTFERWTIGGGGGGVEHPFHVHGVHFRVVRSGGVEPRPEDSGWKDTILVSGETEIVTRFDQPAGRDAPFMYHCHILEHEDAGMMGQFTVT